VCQCTIQYNQECRAYQIGAAASNSNREFLERDTFVFPTVVCFFVFLALMCYIFRGCICTVAPGFFDKGLGSSHFGTVHAAKNKPDRGKGSFTPSIEIPESAKASAGRRRSPHSRPVVPHFPLFCSGFTGQSLETEFTAKSAQPPPEHCEERSEPLGEYVVLELCVPVTSGPRRDSGVLGQLYPGTRVVILDLVFPDAEEPRIRGRIGISAGKSLPGYVSLRNTVSGHRWLVPVG